MDGFPDSENFLRLFRPELFHVFRGNTNRDTVLQTLCEEAETFFQIPSLYPSVLKRESMGSTFFRGRIAVPHPFESPPYGTSTAVGLLPRAVKWDQDRNPS
ncbi:MAG: PTS sugar transporter subunit IIA [Oscillibacter sp.]|nr:PTS sugar transporter subunit IIA [Oscillibacter sp.]